jgi:kynurenine/2-aminoadipate aminotransferase
LHPNGVSQILAIQLFRKWGHEGFLKHVQTVADFYENRRNLLIECARRHLGDRVEFATPKAGMFLWIRIKGIDDSRSLIEGAVKEKVLFLPGKAQFRFIINVSLGGEFNPNGAPSSHVRASYSTATPDQMDQAMQRLAKLLDQ